MTRVQRVFGALVIVQVAHSVEEFVGRLWESFPPARALTGLVAADREVGFLAINGAFIAFGLWCLIWPVRRHWPSALPLATFWAAIAVVNGVVHPLWSLVQGGYTPGVATAPVLFVLGIVLWRESQRVRASISEPKAGEHDRAFPTHISRT